MRRRSFSIGLVLFLLPLFFHISWIYASAITDSFTEAQNTFIKYTPNVSLENIRLFNGVLLLINLVALVFLAISIDYTNGRPSIKRSIRFSLCMLSLLSLLLYLWGLL